MVSCSDGCDDDDNDAGSRPPSLSTEAIVETECLICVAKHLWKEPEGMKGSRDAGEKGRTL